MASLQDLLYLPGDPARYSFLPGERVSFADRLGPVGTPSVVVRATVSRVLADMGSGEHVYVIADGETDEYEHGMSFRPRDLKRLGATDG